MDAWATQSHGWQLPPGTTASNSRGPQLMGQFVGELGPLARAATPLEAAAGDMVVVSIPPRAYLDGSVKPLSGKPVLDTINYMPQRDGRIPGMFEGSVAR